MQKYIPQVVVANELLWNRPSIVGAFITIMTFYGRGRSFLIFMQAVKEESTCLIREQVSL